MSFRMKDAPAEMFGVPKAYKKKDTSTPSAPLDETHIKEADLAASPGKVYKKRAPMAPPAEPGMWPETGATDWLGDGLQEPSPVIQRALPPPGFEMPTPFMAPAPLPAGDPMEERINQRLRYRKR